MRLYPHSFAPISFHFIQSPRDFIVQEIPLYEWSGEGEHLVVQIRKKGLSTNEMLKILSEVLGCKSRDIGYAGLKDKNALTTQFVSLPYSLLPILEKSQNLLQEKNLKILSTHRHHNKIRIGHLKGNAFFIRLKKVMPQDLGKIESILEGIEREGIPNYFGYQRFGKFGDNYLEGQKIAYGEKKIRDKKLAQFLISSYQSHLFNQWLTERIKLSRIVRDFSAREAIIAIERTFGVQMSADEFDSLARQKHFFKILEGEALHHYPFGKLFFENDGGRELRDDKMGRQDIFNQDEQKSQKVSERFERCDIIPCGLLSGKKVTLPSKLALAFQEKFIDERIKEMGSYRFAWIFPQKLQYRYIAQTAHLELSFELPKGSYATVLLEALSNQEIKGGE